MSLHQVLERLSIGEAIQDARVAGLLDLDPLVVSRWLCGEDLCGIYQPIILHDCILDGLDLERRTFYEMVELVGCRVAVAFCACTVPSINSCHCRRRRRRCLRQRRNLRSNRSSLPGLCLRHRRHRLRRRRRRGGKTLSTHISQFHQGGIGEWSL